MKIGITGATGLLGGRLLGLARVRGHETVAFTRSPERGVSGADQTRKFDVNEPTEVADLDAVIHLAGENLLGLWTKSKRRRLRDSRIGTTRHLVKALSDAAQSSSPNKAALVCASAVGYYGDAGDAPLTEDAPSGEGFLAELCIDWEREANRWKEAGGRVVNARLGVVLAPDGGAFPLQRRAFSLGLGGKFGSGDQWFSWIHVDDAADLLLTAAENPNDAWHGPLNVTAPEPVTNAHFTKSLASALKRPAILPAPAFMLRFLLRDMARMFLDSQRVRPAAAIDRGFQFSHPTLHDTLSDLLDR